MTDINLSIPQFVLIPYTVKEKECFTMINTFEIAEVNDDGEFIRLKLRNGSPRIFSDKERQIVIEQLMKFHINNNK
ncbi:hypothetical protein [Aphanothece sacrum]|uniref:NRPS domain-containing protein n=1 Tax=Aphanothece sacrum FPU1 TaxID=1920663 RepID=A0A401IEK1_APHSA|nr:hypothetical protein [Aphanothece sacrum]GBF79712.1 NRPS domain-containing protein [Aphanothece sacrum FPU1]GBF82118.1 NRPS domain-containing protein [Aphanothece sacrum FPU1]GBF82123.1 NRPS domain-containing protein [Aphanothece sacrum FPU1]GBF85052.1 NRPS domain-containing protein [Aphanothece sacrum FPU3]GBF85829.1 NRPS domain-containing protein [Aphanothece sacrum FPU3]